MRDLVYCEKCGKYRDYKSEYDAKKDACVYCAGERKQHPYAYRLGY
jgi:hypothetical protein